MTVLADEEEAAPNAANSSTKTEEKKFLEGGWGWFVVLGSALSHFFVVGTPRSFGVYYEELRDRYQSSASETAWVIALSNTMRMLFGPVAGMLCDRFGCRKVVFAGSLIAASGWTISAFSNGIPYLYFSLGIVAGFGGCLVFTPAYIIVGQYFSKKKGKAMALSTLGSGFGTVAIAPLISVMLVHYGYTGAMMITGALMFNNAIAAALYRPVEDNFPKKTKTDIKAQEEHIAFKESEVAKPEVKVESQGKCGNFKKNFVILKNPTFFLYCIEITAMSIVIQTFLTFLPGLAREYKAATASQASLLLSIMGVADMAGRLLIGFFMDLKQIRHRRRLFHAIIGLPMALCCVITGMMTTYVTLSILTVCFGVFAGAFHSQRATIVSEFVPKDQMSSTVGWVILFQGFGNILGPPVAGALKDSTKTYSIGYYFAGTSLGITCALFIANYYVLQWKRKKAHSLQ